MTGLLPDLYPLTFAWGVLQIDFDRAADFFENWRRKTRDRATRRELSGTLPDMLAQQLDPLTMPPTRELLTATKSQWVAYFENSINGGDPATPVSYMAGELRCRGIAFRSIPHTKKKGTGAYGAVSFELFGAEKTEFLNYIRTVSAANDGGKWVFSATGTVQDFEETDQYNAKRVADRFTPEMLERYAKALGIDLFDPDFYGGRGSLFESGGALRQMSLREAKASTS